MRRTAIEENHLLAALPPDAYVCLAGRLDAVEVEPRQLLALPDQHVGHVYFPRTAVVSLLVPMEDGAAVEGATLGNEGMLGLETFLGDGMARVEVVAQIGGAAGRMNASAFREVTHTCQPLQHLLQRYSLALMNQIARTSGCNRVHSVNERVARVLLMAADRVGEDTFPLTHELLATMLGVRRASVSQAAAWLQHTGLIDYRRGTMDIVDRPGLESVACEDYRLSRTAYDQLNAEQWD